MKKYLILTVLILSFTVQNANCTEIFNKPEDLENIQNYIFESPAKPADTKKISPAEDVDPEEKIDVMPLFKKTRIKLTNYLREREYKKYQKQLEKEKLNKEKSDEIDDEITENEVKINNKTTDEVLELQGGVREQAVPNDVQLDADNIDYDDVTKDLIATGSPILYFPPQNTTIKAKKIVYNRDSNELKAFEDVEIIRDGNSVFGDYIQINMNEENAFMDNVKTRNEFLTITARKSKMDEKIINLYNGRIVSDNSHKLILMTQMVGYENMHEMLLDPKDKSSMQDYIGDTAVNIKAKEVIVNAKKNHDIITFKKATVNYDDRKLFSIPSLTVHTNKNHNYFEANYPEIGSMSRIGMYAGPGFVIDTPLQDGSTIKLIPMITSKSGIGIGGILKYRSATNYTNFGYSSNTQDLVLKGKQLLDDKLFFQYGSNSYMDEWFLGGRMSKYNAELVYHDRALVRSTIGDKLNLRFQHRVGLGYMQNNDYNTLGENISERDIGTARLRYMAEIDQDLYKYEDIENRKLFRLSLALQGSSAIYGTGDTQFIGRLGPRIHSQYKNWMQDIGFFLSAYQDGTPMQMYDSYRYGHGNLYIREALRLCKYLTVAWAGSITVTDDSPNGKPFQENAFIISIGPDDFKFNLGYDWVREHTYFAFVIAMDTKGSTLDYDKMVIKNYDRLSKSNTEKVELKVFDNMPEAHKKAEPKKMMYAEVIDIEDPDREHI